MKHIPLFAGFLFAVAPLGALISGCSGGSGGLSTFPPTPLPTATASGTATPSPTATGSLVSNFTLGNGQRAILSTRTNGTQITGTIQILAPATTALRAKSSALTTSIRIGTFAVSGTFTPPRGYNITARDGSETLFTLSGFFPTTTQTGTYSLSFNGQTENGILPRVGDPFPTPVPTTRPTASPTASPAPTITPDPNITPGLSVLRNLSLTPGSGFNGTGLRGSTIARVQTPTFSNATSFFGSGTFPLANFNDTTFTFEGPSLNRAARAGDVFNLQSAQAAQGILYYQEPGNKNWQTRSGVLRVTAATPTSVSFTLENVVFEPQTFGTTSATGTFTLSATGVLSGN